MILIAYLRKYADYLGCWIYGYIIDEKITILNTF